MTVAESLTLVPGEEVLIRTGMGFEACCRGRFLHHLPGRRLAIEVTVGLNGQVLAAPKVITPPHHRLVRPAPESRAA